MDHNNDPIIILKVSKDTSDLRDKMLKKFIEERGCESELLRIAPMPSTDADTEYLIRPIKSISLDPERHNQVHPHLLWRLIAQQLTLTEIENNLYHDGNGDYYDLDIFGFRKRVNNPTKTS